MSDFLKNLLLIQQSAPGKPLYQSKRFWCAIISLAAILIQTQTSLGWVIDPQTQMLLLTGINFVVGLLTKSPTGFAWAEDNPEKPGGAARPTLIDAGPPEAIKPPGPGGAGS